MTILDAWSYDKVKDQYNGLVFTLESSLRKIKKISPNEIIFPDSEFEPTIPFLAKDSNSNLELLANDLYRQKEILECAMPIRIGPATIDSLMYRVPDSYECIRNQKLPFEHMFFDFLEPIETTLPLSKIPANMLGFHFGITREYDSDVPELYAVRIFYDVGNKIIPFRIGFTPENPHILKGQEGWGLCGSFFKANIVSGYLRYNSMSERFMQKTKPPNQGDAKQKDEIKNLANLGTNFVNYINAHNVTVVKTHREVKVQSKRSRKRKKTVSRFEDYCLIVIKDSNIRKYDEPETTGEKLEWRVYVRGHDRRYRDTNGNIEKTIWIAPFLKGPLDAPWRDQRYQVLAEKLIREKKMIEDALGLQ